MVRLFRADQGNHADRAHAHFGARGESGNFLDDNIGFNLFDFLALPACPVRCVDVDKRWTETRVPQECAAAAFFRGRIAWKSA